MNKHATFLHLGPTNQRNRPGSNVSETFPINRVPFQVGKKATDGTMGLALATAVNREHADMAPTKINLTMRYSLFLIEGSCSKQEVITPAHGYQPPAVRQANQITRIVDSRLGVRPFDLRHPFPTGCCWPAMQSG